MKNLTIDAERLWDELMETAAIGGTAKGGICRLTLTDLDRQVRDWFKSRAQALGCRVTVDDMGAMFARRERQRPTCRRSPSAAISTPSRPAASSTACSACSRRWKRCARCIDAGYETYAPIEVVNWTNEEGSRFAPAMVASGVFAKVFERDWAHARQDRAGVTFGAALDAIGYRGPSAAASTRCRRSSNCISSRARSSKPRARTSAWSPACRRCAGTR